METLIEPLSMQSSIHKQKRRNAWADISQIARSLYFSDRVFFGRP
jgi:hypothetical protein